MYMADVCQTTQGPPYTPMIWATGGPPIKRVDIPAQTIFMLLFLIGAIVHMKIFQGNRSERHKFLPNLFIFCKNWVLFPHEERTLTVRSLLHVTHFDINSPNCVDIDTWQR